MRNPLRFIGWMLKSNFFLAMIAVQVFVQVWMMATDMPVIGLFLSIWLSWKLGGLAGYADLLQPVINQERMVARQLVELQDEYDGMPPDMRLALAEPHARVVERMTHLHQLLVEQINLPRAKLKFRDVFPSPTRWLARRRQRKIMASAKVVHP